MLDLATASPRSSAVTADAYGRSTKQGTSSVGHARSGSSLAPSGVGSYLSEQLVSSQQTPSLDEQLFDASAAAKIATVDFAMHLPRKWRDRFFEHLDRMHEADDWEEDDVLLKTQSVRTFLRAWLLLRPLNNPGLGISSRGNLIAGWAEAGNRLTLEFYARDLVSWLVMIPHVSEDWVERGAGTTKLADLKRMLEPYKATEWLYGQEDQSHPAS